MTPLVQILASNVAFCRRVERPLCERALDVYFSSSLEEFLKIFDPARPGCILVELWLPETSVRLLKARLGELDYISPLLFLAVKEDVPTSLGATSQVDEFLDPSGDVEQIVTIIERAVARDLCNRQRLATEEADRCKLGRLSDGERRVLELVLSGEANKCIARRLGLSQRAVEDRRANVMEKLEVDNLAALVRFGISLNLHSAHEPAARPHFNLRAEATSRLRL